MIKTYFKVIVRSLARNKTFSLINLLGLSIGLMCFTLIGLYVVDEFSFDRYHAKTERIYQVTIAAGFGGKIQKWNAVPNLTAPTLAREIPEVEKSVRILKNNFTGKAFISSENIKSTENNMVWADPALFEIFTIPFIKGDPSTALTRTHTVVLTEASAIKYFGSTDVIGKGMKIDRDTVDFEVTGVIENFPGNSHLQFPVIASFMGSWGDKNETWGNASFETFILVHENIDPATLDKKIAETIERVIPDKESRWFTLETHALKDIHLQYADTQDFSGAARGDMGQLNILIGLGCIILLIAAVNYMNLATAQSQRRYKEIGINKALGATSQQMARKFYLETNVFVVMSLGLSIALVILALPTFNSITGKNFSEAFLSSSWFWISFLAVWVILTLLAGFYPALYLSSFSPKEVLKGSLSGTGSNSTLRKTLVVVQFSVSIVLIISTLILYQQLGFMRSKKLGYQPEQVIAIGTAGAENRDQVNSLKAALEGLPFVSSAAKSQGYPGVSPSGRNLPSLDGQGEGKSLGTVRATPEILSTLGIKLLAGKTLPEKTAGDTTVQIVLNKAAVDFLGLTPEEAVNRKIRVNGFQGSVEVVGVIEDFHFSSLREPIGAYAFHNAPTESYSVLLVKIETNNLTESIGKIESEFKKIIPSAFEFIFLDQQLQSLYHSEEQLGQIILIFSGLAIFIACLGLYALAAYTTEQRTKEIGIRKVMGASVLQLSNMLSKDFLKLVVISFIIAVPIGYYAMTVWLQGFAYRVEINLLVFVLAGIISVLIAWFTVGFESFKAARSNPIKSLRSE